MTLSKSLSRRQFLNISGLAVASAGLAGCTSSMNTDRFRAETAPYFRNPALEGRFSDPRYGAELEGPVYGGEPSGLPPESAYYAEMYGPKVDEGFNIPAVPYQQIDARFYRQ